MKKTDIADPWRAPVVVAQIPEGGVSLQIEASQPQRETMADIAGLREITSARAEFELMPESGGTVHVSGRVWARIGQTCVVTLDPIENDIDEVVDLMFAPEGAIKQLAAEVDETDDGEGDVPEAPEPIEGGVIDVGRLATDVLFLAIDPYPRKPGVVFEPRVETPDPEDHPFAALKSLRLSDTGAGEPGKPKRK
jgi:hypothetical protein